MVSCEGRIINDYWRSGYIDDYWGLIIMKFIVDCFSYTYEKMPTICLPYLITK